MRLEKWDYYTETRRMDYHNDARRWTITMMLEEWDYCNDARRMGLSQ